MDAYVPNRSCGCTRCRCRGFMGPIVLMTLGVLFLLGEFTRWDFGRTWPILLIAIGAVKVLSSSTTSDAGHVPPQMPDRLRQGFAPSSYPPPAAPPSSPAPQDQQPPQGVNHV